VVSNGEAVLKRVTIHDVAEAAGVSLATVDRVLNTRPGVRKATIEKVRQAVESLNYQPDVFAAGLAKKAPTGSTS